MRSFEQRLLLPAASACWSSLFVDQFQTPELRNAGGGSCAESDAKSACNPFTDPARCRDVDDCPLDPERAQLREPGLVDGFGKGAAQTCLDLGPSPFQIVVLRQLLPGPLGDSISFVGGSPTPQAARESSSGPGLENQPPKRARTGLAQFAWKTNCALAAVGQELPRFVLDCFQLVHPGACRADCCEPCGRAVRKLCGGACRDVSRLYTGCRRQGFTSPRGLVSGSRQCEVISSSARTSQRNARGPARMVSGRVCRRAPAGWC